MPCGMLNDSSMTPLFKNCPCQKKKKKNLPLSGHTPPSWCRTSYSSSFSSLGSGEEISKSCHQVLLILPPNWHPFSFQPTASSLASCFLHDTLTRVILSECLLTYAASLFEVLHCFTHCWDEFLIPFYKALCDLAFPTSLALSIDTYPSHCLIQS